MSANATMNDPKSLMANIIASHINNLPRTRSGRGWFLASDGVPLFVNVGVKELFSSYGVAVFYFSPDLGPLYWLFLNKRLTSNQEYAEAMMTVAGFGGMHDVRIILEKAIADLPHAGWVHRRIPNDKEKVEFISRIVDECFQKKNNFAIDTMQNFLFFLVPLLHDARKRSSVQDCVLHIVRELGKKYKKCHGIS